MFERQGNAANRCHSSAWSVVPATDPARELGAASCRWRVGILLGCLVLVAVPIGCEGDFENAMAQVRELQDAGEYSASVEELRKILAESPELAEANYRFGVALAHTGNSSRAIWPLQKASESDEYQIPATLLIASVQFRLTNFEEAIRAANRILEVDGTHRTALTIRAQANLGIHHLDEALLDTSRLVASHPDDYQMFVVHATVLAEMGRMEEAEAAQFRIKTMSEASGDPRIAGRGCLAPPLFAKDHLKDVERAEELYDVCAAKYPADPVVVTHIAGFFDSIGKMERATELIRTAIATAPEDISLHAALANRFARQGKAADAESVLTNAVDQFGSAAAWNMLVGHYRRQGDPARALEAIDKVAELTETDSDLLQFTRADLLVDLGELDRAEAVAKTLEEPIYATMIRGRILLSRGDARAALAAFDQGIANWPNNAGARYLAGVAALRLGDFERAVVELRESVRVDDAATDAARILARLYFERTDFRQAIALSAIARKQSDPNQRAEALKLESRAWAALGEFDKARSTADALGSLPGQRGRAAAELALVERMATGPKQAAAAVENLELDLTDPVNEEALRALTQDWVALQQIDRALASIDAALKANPNSASLHALHGTTLARTYSADEARIAFERSLEIDDRNAEALGGLAALIASGGNTARAIELFERASESDPNTARYRYATARLLLAAGDRENAEARLREIVKLFAGHVGSRNDLAWMLAESGKNLDLALSLAEEAGGMSLEPEILDTLGFVHLKRGEFRKAVEALDRAVAAGAASPSIHYRLGIALIESADDERAREELNRALGAGSFPEAEDARRRLAQFEKQPTDSATAGER